MRVVSIVGMAGSGKSEVAHIFESRGFTRIRFGDITDAEIKKRGLELNEQNERVIREHLREQCGMAAYARLNLLKLDAALKHSCVVIDGLYSWEEYILLKDYYGEDFILVAIWSSPDTRYNRLSQRRCRPLRLGEAIERDRSEIEMVNKGGPIAMADYTITNESSLNVLREETEVVITKIGDR